MAGARSALQPGKDSPASANPPVQVPRKFVMLALFPPAPATPAPPAYSSLRTSKFVFTFSGKNVMKNPGHPRWSPDAA
jgi:hypothetical protein